MRTVIAVLLGVLFGLGVGIAGLARPAVILGFLDVTGAWDPTLLITIITSTSIYGLGYALLRHRNRAIFAPCLSLPAPKRIDRRIVIGGALFGIGWGVAGMCPGANLVGLFVGGERAALFAVTMVIGIWLSAAYRGEAASLLEPSRRSASTGTSPSWYENQETLRLW